eukprot:scaffold309677_cov21-Tisochrysis_lutea.AAC.1
MLLSHATQCQLGYQHHRNGKNQVVGLTAKCPNRPLPLSRAQQHKLLCLFSYEKQQQRGLYCAAAAEQQQSNVASSLGPQPAGPQPLRFELDAGCQQVCAESPLCLQAGVSRPPIDMMILETGEVGRQANGSIMAIQGCAFTKKIMLERQLYQCKHSIKLAIALQQAPAP